MAKPHKERLRHWRFWVFATGWIESKSCSPGQASALYTRAMSTFRALLLAFAALCLTGTATLAETEPVRRAVVVLDSSASMLLPIDGFKKYYLLRKNMQSVMAQPLTEAEIGLVAYGHRRRAACDDVELLRQPEPFDPGRFLRTAFSVRPKGASPVSEALKVAASAFGSTPGGGGKILLMAGAADSCQQDPCAMAADLVAANPQLSIDVLGIGITEVDSKQLSCIASAGHGRMVLATSMDDMEAALREAFAGLTAPPLPALVPGKLPASAQSSGLHLSAQLADGGPAWTQAVAWSVRKAQEGGQPGPVVFEAQSPTAVADLPPGVYDVEASAGLVRLHQSAEIKADASTDLAVILNAGNLRLTASANKPEDKLDDISYTVSRVSDAAGTPAETVTLLRGLPLPLLLPAGQYRIVGERGSLRVERTVSLAAGKDAVADFAMATGVLQIDAPLPASGPGAVNTTYFISEDDPDQPLGQRDVARSAMASPSFDLAAGAYHVLARQGAAQVRVDAVVKAGETTRLALPMATGRLRLATLGLANPDTLPEDLISYTVERLDTAGAPQGVVARSSQKNPSLELETGRYRVTGRVGLVNVSTTLEASIRPGTDTRVDLPQKAALMDLRFAGDDTNAIDVFWEIRTPEGPVLWSTVSPAPLIALAPGDYEIHAIRAGHDASARVTLGANERKTVDVQP